MFRLSRRSHFSMLSVLIAVLLCVVSTTMADNTNRQVFTFMDEPMPPYTVGVEGKVCQKGLIVEILDELFNRMGLDYRIMLVPWARAIEGVTVGKADGIPLLMKNKDREQFLLYSAPVVENRDMLYFLPDRLGNFQLHEFRDLQGHTIGLVRGYTYSDTLLAAIKKYNIKVTYSKNSTMNFRMLHGGRFDFVVEDESTTQGIMRKHPEWETTTATAKKPISNYYWHIGISRLSPLAHRIDAINATLETMREDGTLTRILNKR